MTTSLKGLAEHLEQRYGIEVDGLTPLEPWAPDGVQRVDRRDGTAWVARVFPPERPAENTHGDAEILRFLHRHDYPAERCAHDEPVSMLGDRSVLVTVHAPGDNARADASHQMLETCGELLGRLHTLPIAEGAPAREAGGWHHLSVAGGGRRTDVDALLELMEPKAEGLPADQLDAYHEMRARLARIDDGAGLPEALINIDFAGPNLVKSPDGPVLVDWTNAGRGPRVLSMNLLMAAHRDLSLADAWVAGYRRHAQLEPAELDRLANVLPGFSDILACWGFVFRGTAPADVLVSMAHSRSEAERVAKRVSDAFASSGDAPFAHRQASR